MRSIGNYGEDLAIQHLISNGYEIIKRNYYTRFGEIDIIARINNRIYIIEVKFLSKQYLHSGYKINYKKKQRMIKCTQLFMEEFKLFNVYIQFDLIAIINKKINHINHIFDITN